MSEKIVEEMIGGHVMKEGPRQGSVLLCSPPLPLGLSDLSPCHDGNKEQELQ